MLLKHVNRKLLTSLVYLSTLIHNDLFQLMIIRNGITKKNLIQMMVDVEQGKHVSIPGIEIIPVRAFRLEPLGNSTQGAGIMTLDGEVIPTGLIQAHIMPSAAKVFVK